MIFKFKEEKEQGIFIICLHPSYEMRALILLLSLASAHHVKQNLRSAVF